LDQSVCWVAVRPNVWMAATYSTELAAFCKDTGRSIKAQDVIAWRLIADGLPMARW
jgi:hypothetical protein